jgi:hypothetical protein
MNLPLPTYKSFINLYAIGEALHMFVNQIDEALKTLTAETNMRFHSKGHLVQMVQMVMYTAGLPMNEDSFKDIEQYLGDGINAILRDYGARS